MWFRHKILRIGTKGLCGARRAPVPAESAQSDCRFNSYSIFLVFLGRFLKGRFWRYLCQDGKVFRGNSAGTEEFFEVTRPGWNSF